MVAFDAVERGLIVNGMLADGQNIEVMLCDVLVLMLFLDFLLDLLSRYIR
jgi:hypothetical protein